MEPSSPAAAIHYAALAIVMAMICVQPARAGVEPTAHVSLNEIRAGELLFQSTTPGRYLPAVQLESRADIDISGIVATVEVVQRFRNSTREWAAGVYVFPLPETAAVNAMEMRIGDRIIVGEIREKQQARREYQKAKRAGKKTALVEQRRPNMFSTAVANIAPGQEVEVRLTYVEKVRYTGGRFNLRFPMTITPRYIPGQPRPPLEGPLAPAPGSGWALNTDQVPDAAEITPFLDPLPPHRGNASNSIAVSVRVDAGLPLAEITSAYHDIQVVRQSDIYVVDLATGTAPMDRDFELTWNPAVGSVPAAALFKQVHDGETYALAMILPPDHQAQRNAMPRETVFVIDTSGSMGGEPIRQARAALELALTRLGGNDRFNIIAFNDFPTALFPASVAADAGNLATARRFVRHLQSGGGTEMLSALNAAFGGHGPDLGEDASGRLRQVIFITDGAVGNEEALFRAISDGLGDRRLFTVGIGSAPNSYFMRKAAQFGRGTFTYVGRLNEVEIRMDELFARIEKPMLRNIAVAWPDDDVVSIPDPVPDLYAGQPIVLTAKIKSPGGTLRLTGDTADGPWEQELRLAGGRQHAGVATLWARDRIAALTDRIALDGETDALRAQALGIALAHRLVSRYTSFIAVDRKISRPKQSGDRSHNVANLRPHGQSAQSYAYPLTATSATEAFWLGVAGLLATMLLWLRVFTLRAAPA